MKPSRYFTFSTLAISSAESRLVSGIGITTSMPWSGRSRRIFSPSATPMRMRALCTEMFSIIESGRAKYTYSKMHGACASAGAHMRVCSSPRAVITTPSPGSTSRRRSKPSTSSATDSDATMYSVAARARALAQHQRADAVRVAERDQAQAQHGADHRVAALGAAVDALDRAERDLRVSAFCRSNSCANTFSSTSLSDSVLTLRRSCSNTSAAARRC